MPALRFAPGLMILLATLAFPLRAGQFARPLPPSVYDSLGGRSVFVFSDQLASSIDAPRARFAATHYVGCQKMPRRAIDLIRSFNPNFLHLHYKLGVTLDTIPDHAMILGGDWVNNSDPRSNYNEARPNASWFLKDPAGAWVVHDNTRIVMKLDDPGFREFWVNSCLREMEANACDGVFADTYTIEAIAGRTTYPALFGPDAVNAMTTNWLPKLNDYGQYVYARLDSAGYYFFPNIDNLQTNWVKSAGAHYYTGQNLHAAMMEGWGDWSSGDDAFTGMAGAVTLQRAGVFVHGEGYFGDNGMNPALSHAQQRMWLVGTYLLCNHGRMYLSMYGPGELGMSVRPLWFPEYELDLGPWLEEWIGPYPKVWNGVYRRDYRRGFVLVNGGASSKAVNLGGNFWLAEDAGLTDQYWADDQGRESVRLKYTPVSSLTLPAHSAAVLLSQDPLACNQSLRGDFDSDGRLTVLDALRLIMSLRSGATDPCLDFDGDGAAGVLDAIALLRELINR